MAKTTNPPTPSDFSSIATIDLSFTGNEANPRLPHWMNKIYQDAIPEHERIFTDPSAQSELRTDCVTTIRDIIIKDMILKVANNTKDETAIAPLITNAAIHVLAKGLPPRRLTKKHLLLALQHARTQSLESIMITIDTSSFFLLTNSPINYHDWSVFTTDPTLAAAPAESEPPSSNAPVPSANTPALTPSSPLDYNAIATAMATAIAQIQLNPTSPADTQPQQGQNQFPNSQSSSNNAEQYFFPGGFSAEVRARYDRKNAGKLILGNTVSPPFDDGTYYS